MISGILCTSVAALGMFSGNHIFLVLGAMVVLLENAIGIISKRQSSLLSLFVCVIIGVIWGSLVSTIWCGILMGACLEGVSMGLSTVFIFLNIHKYSKKGAAE